MQMDWEEMEAMTVETPKDELVEEIPANAALPNPGLKHSTIAESLSHHNSEGLLAKQNPRGQSKTKR